MYGLILPLHILGATIWTGGLAHRTRHAVVDTVRCCRGIVQNRLVLLNEP